MKFFSKAVTSCLLGIILCLPGTSFAYNFLQLGASGGVFDGVDNIYAVDPVFDLYALVDPTKTNKYVDGNTYYISAALVGPNIVQGDPSSFNFGSFLFDGTEYQVTADMQWGTPPVEEADNLGPHSVFPTYFIEFSFDFGGTGEPDADHVVPHNTQDNPGGYTLTGGSDYLLGKAFNVDVSNLAPYYSLHFDLYTTDGDGLQYFAPFSHDVDTSPVPEPATLLLFGAGILGLGFLKRKK